MTKTRLLLEIITFEETPLVTVILVFIISTAVITICGTFLTRYADIIADITKMGEALAGAVLLGAVTSLAGIVTSAIAAVEGYVSLAVSNAIGGIAVQTVFLAVADIVYRRANLEHAAASLSNLLYSILLIGLLSILLVIVHGPEITVLGVHPFSPVLIIIYIIGLVVVKKAEKKPMWRPIITIETVKDVPKEAHYGLNRKKIWLGFIACAGIVIAGGYLVAESSIAIAEKTKLTESFVGLMLTAVATSLPELIVSVSAVRQGALTLAVGNIVGGNSFEVIIVALSDFLFLKGSLLHHTEPSEKFIISLTLVLMSVLTMGLLYRQKHGAAGIGWEGLMVLIVFIVGYVMLYFMNFNAS